MITCNIRKKYSIISIKDVYFSKALKNYNPKTDITHFFQSAEKPISGNDFRTLHIDLTANESNIFSCFDRRTRTELKKVLATSKITTEQTKCITSEDINEFVDFYNKFSQQRGIDECDRALLNNIAKSNALMISKAIYTSIGGFVCCMHAHSSDNERARAIYSCSSRLNSDKDKTLWNDIAMANRLLHWTDMLFFKNNGIRVYDFGGLALSDNPALQSIDNFKLGFGGSIITEYNGYIAHTLLGRLALLYLNKQKHHE